MPQKQEEEKAEIKALENTIARSLGKAVLSFFETGYYHGVKAEKEERLKKEAK